jgi:HK97 family phage portal protein
MAVVPAAAPSIWTHGRALVRGRDGVVSLPPPPTSAAFGMPGPYVYDATTAQSVPAVTRALGVYTTLMKQMPLDAMRGFDRVEPAPTICQRPDPDRGYAWFVQVSVEDYLLLGNAIAYVTSRGFDGWPRTITWLPASWVYVIWDSYNDVHDVRYTYLGYELNPDDVIHVRRGADRMYPVRGVGIVEQHLSTLDRVAMEEVYEAGALSNGAVPSVAVITPQASLDQDTADEAKDRWMTNYAGPVREPIILPNGTQVVPLAWSPTDTQLTEARRLSLLDVANMFNLDGYWLGAPVAGMTYRTAGPQYQQILRTSIEGLCADFEDEWSWKLMPRGTNVRFRREQLLREDLATSSTAARTLYGGGPIAALPEARAMVGLPPNSPAGLGASADIEQPAEPLPESPPPSQEGGTDDAATG